MSRMSVVLCAMILAVVSVPAFAQIVTPVDPTVYDGTCTNTSITATVYTGSPYNTLSGSYGFTCTGTFYGRITAKFFLEDPNQPVCSPDGTCGYAQLAYKTKQWPVMGWKCETYFDSRQCISYVKEEKPVNASLSATLQSTAGRFISRGILEWVTGPCTTYLGYTSCPTKSITVSKSSLRLTPITN
jgi:hypothetical protein